MSQNKKKKKLRNPFQKLVKQYNKLPETTRLLVLAVIALTLVVLVVLVMALSSGNKKPKVEVKPEPTATASAEPTKTPVTKSLDGKPIGTVAIQDSIIINIHTEANTTSGVLGIVQEGESYDVYEIKKDRTYTWYKIGEEQWIADDDSGDWLIYKEK